MLVRILFGGQWSQRTSILSSGQLVHPTQFANREGEHVVEVAIDAIPSVKERESLHLLVLEDEDIHGFPIIYSFILVGSDR